MVTVSMPQLGETVTEGTVTAWHTRVGDRVARDEPLLEVSTDKVDSEIPSPVDGVVEQILAAEGDVVEIGQPLLVIAADGAAAPDRPHPAQAPESAGSDGVAERAVRRVAVPGAGAPPAGPAANGSGTATAPAGRRTADGSFLSPAVRRLVGEHGLDPATLTGTGTGGRISISDVEAAIASSSRHPPGHVTTAREGDTIVAFTPIRRRTAAHMVESLATSAHTLVVTEVDYVGVERARDAARDRFRERHGAGLTYLPFIATAAIDAIRAFPRVNASMGDDELIVRGAVNLGVAVDLDFEGLIVPVVRDADRLRLPALAVEMAEMASKARARALSPDDVAGGTFTMTNAGGYGTLLTAPIINQPQVAILATDGIAVHPVAVEHDGGHALGFHPTGNLCVSFDHRAFDGAYASAFLAHIRDHLQDHDWESEL